MDCKDGHKDQCLNIESIVFITLISEVILEDDCKLNDNEAFNTRW